MNSEPEAELPAEITSATPETEQTMEVHHHPHHSHEKKTWKNYFWEFFMLFTAVFCGSLAELQLEHYIENKREYQYIEAFVRDLKQDTTSINAIVTRNLRREILLDSILVVSNTDLTVPANAKLFVNLFMRSAYRPNHIPSSIAIQQLKNTGSFRLLNHRKGVADSILQYEKFNEQLTIHNDLYQNDLNNIWEAFYPICDVKIFRDTSFATFTATKRALTDKPVPPLHLSQEKLSVFTGHITRQVLINANNRAMLENQHLRATGLIRYLEKEYNLREQ